MNIFQATVEKMKHRQQILAILIFAFVAVIVWIAASLFTSQKRTEISKDLLNLAKPLTPTINQDVIQRLRQKGVYFDSQLEDFPIYMITKDSKQKEIVVEIDYEPSPSPSSSPKPSPSPQPEKVYSTYSPDLQTY